MVITIWKSLKHMSESSIQNSKIMDKCQGIVISDFEFRGTFKEMRVRDLQKAFNDLLKSFKKPLKRLQTRFNGLLNAFVRPF